MRRSLPLAVAGLAIVAVTLAADRHEGVASCASSLCHGATTPRSAGTVQQHEYVVWSNFDPHSRAYRSLLEPAGVAIAKRLGIPAAHQAQECLACHAEVVPPARRGARFQLADGIGCESCHGAAERWLAGHAQSPAVPHAENLAKGLVALDRLPVRAATCVACHVGDSQRFADHRMMAAGHPRLVFELDTYTELWRTSGGREHYRPESANANGSTVPPAIAAWLQGLATATTRQFELVEARIGATRGLPDFSLYGCYSCHRGLRASDWSDDAAGPGALRLQDGQARTLLALARAVGELSGADELEAALEALQHAATRDTENVPAAAQAAERSVALLHARLVSIDWTRARQRTALTGLAQAARSGEFPDYATAEQVAMAMVLLLAELDLDRTARGEIDALFAALEDDAAFDRSRFARVLARLAPQ